MKHIETSELLDAVPIKQPPRLMSRSEKLKHLAQLVRRHGTYLRLVNGLEYIHPFDLERITVRDWAQLTALALATSDAAFQAQGLKADATIGETLRFLGLSQHQAHAFSCDCGGAISNEEQARRIERLA